MNAERRQDTDSDPAIPGRHDDPPVRREQHAEPRKIAYPPSAVTSAMLMTFSPSALSPPSANTSACTSSTTATQSAPA